MKTTFRSLLERYAQTGEKFIGSYAKLSLHEELEIMKLGGVDFVIIDMEHDCLSMSDVMPMIWVSEACGLATLVRVPCVDEWTIKKVLDMGASGIKVPGVSTAEQARMAVAFAKYPPEGRRGACPFVRSNGYGGDRVSCYEHGNRETVVSVIIEGVEGVRNMEEIISVPGVDTISVGNVDLSLALGVPGQAFHPKVMKAVYDVAALCEKYGKTCSAQIVEADDAARFRAMKGVSHFHIDDLPPLMLKTYTRLCSKIRAVTN